MTSNTVRRDVIDSGLVLMIFHLPTEKEINIDEIDFSKEKVKTLKKLLMEKYDDPCKV